MDEIIAKMAFLAIVLIIIALLLAPATDPDVGQVAPLIRIVW